MAICSMCGVEHSRFRDKNHEVYASYCSDCHAGYMRRTRPRYGELSAAQRFKANCRAYSNVLQRRGKIEPSPCEICGSDAQKHHENYGDPRNVRWLCLEHHLLLHENNLT
jgi:hypothetical protein